ncbi:MAG: helix-turn-helix transcriptional regulator [Synergistaceae bacterium]|jgi:DNA-binding CsgD family transcriptional regulator|nr:helix-turn-helix transcriptional regulator [Synergistaceae bacterium]
MKELAEFSPFETMDSFNRHWTLIAVFVFFFSWLLAFPFEGRILYALAELQGVSTPRLVFGAMVFHGVGLFSCGYFVRTRRRAKKLTLFSAAFCAAASCAFFLPPSPLWTAALFSSSFLAGCCLAAWGLFCVAAVPKSERFKIMADALIGSNLLMILLNAAAVHFSPKAGLGLSVLFLAVAFWFARGLPAGETSLRRPPGKSKDAPSVNGPLAFLCLFIVVFTINSGLMYQVQNPAFSHLERLTAWYWAVPYIAALVIVRNLPRKANRAYILNVAIAMIGFSFIAFFSLSRSVTGYLIVNTLMLGACGVYDLFWWSILGDMLDMGDNNPVRILGAGLAANVFGVLLGGLIGSALRSPNVHHPMLLVGAVICVIVVMLPLLHNRLILLLKEHIFLTVFQESLPQEQNQMIQNIVDADKLTRRENETLALLIQGKSYRAIAEELGVTENTIKTHARNIYSKTGARNRAELVSMVRDEKSAFARNHKSL